MECTACKFWAIIGGRFITDYIILSPFPSPISLILATAMTDNTELPTASTSSTAYIHPRREPFEHGLIPIPKLIFTDGTQTLASLKEKLVHRSTQSPTHRVDSLAVSETLQISPDHAQLIIDTLVVVIESDPEIESVGVDVFDDRASAVQNFRSSS